MWYHNNPAVMKLTFKGCITPDISSAWHKSLEIKREIPEAVRHLG